MIRPTTLCSDANVSFHAREPVIAFVVLMHLRTSFATRVPGLGWGLDGRRLNAVALLEQATMPRQFVFFQQMTGAQDGGLLSRRTSAQRQACKLMHRLRVAVYLCRGWIDQRKPWLREGKSKRRLERVSRAFTPARGLSRFIQHAHFCPRQNVSISSRGFPLFADAGGRLAACNRSMPGRSLPGRSLPGRSGGGRFA